MTNIPEFSWGERIIVVDLSNRSKKTQGGNYRRGEDCSILLAGGEETDGRTHSNFGKQNQEATQPNDWVNKSTLEASYLFK